MLSLIQEKRGKTAFEKINKTLVLFRFEKISNDKAKLFGWAGG